MLQNKINKLTIRIDGKSFTYTLAALGQPPYLFTASGSTLSLGHGPSAADGTRLWRAHDARLRPNR